MYYKSIISSPLGDLVAIASDTHLLMLEFSDGENLERKIQKLGFVIPTQEESAQKKEQILRTSVGQNNKILEQTEQELREYFAGTRKDFTIPLAPVGTDFQKQAWQALERIPYSETRSYKEEAILAGSPKAVRAIGGANNKNPIVIIIPCHRVIGADGSLVGYGSGIERKVWLLEHEKRNI